MMNCQTCGAKISGKFAGDHENKTCEAHFKAMLAAQAGRVIQLEQALADTRTREDIHASDSEEQRALWLKSVAESKQLAERVTHLQQALDGRGAEHRQHLEDKLALKQENARLRQALQSLSECRGIRSGTSDIHGWKHAMADLAKQALVARQAGDALEKAEKTNIPAPVYQSEQHASQETYPDQMYRAHVELALGAVYHRNPSIIAELCDEHLDKSGALLGRVRTISRHASNAGDKDE